MEIVYSKWVDIIGDVRSFKKILDLFNQLLNQTAGDVNQALNYLNEIDKKYGILKDMGGLDSFIAKIKCS